jgi:hypothetical protein
MKDIFLNFLKHSCAFLLLMSTAGYSVDQKTSFADYLEEIRKEGGDIREYTFNSDLKILAGAYLNYSVKNIIVAFDMSASTKFESHNLDRHGNKIERPANATKHIALAQAEALSLVFKYLAQTNSNDAKLYLTGFSLNAQRPVGIAFPYTLNLDYNLNDLAKDLPNKLPYPQFDGTYLTGALREVLKASESITMGNTLFVIVTDGQTSDAEKTSELLKEVITKFTGDTIHFRFDILTIGAGSILDKSTKIVRDAGLTQVRSRSERFSDFSHVSSNSPYFGGAQCNRGYLELLSSLKSTHGKGQYGGAYKDYEDLQLILSNYFADLDNGAHKLLIEADKGGFWQAKDWQLNVVEKFLSSDNLKVTGTYSSGDFIVDIVINPKTGLIEMTDAYGKTRRCLWLESSCLKLDQRGDSFVYDVSSSQPVIQNMINRNFPTQN